MIRSLNGRDRVCIAAGVILLCIAVFLWLSVPEPFAFYVHNGLMLPVFRNSLLFMLIGCGIVLSRVSHSTSLAAYLAILGSALWFGLHHTEAFVLSNGRLTKLVENYPIMTTSMGIVIGVTLLCPFWLCRYLVPLMCICCGLSVGLLIILESPLDDNYLWFSWASGLGGMLVVLATAILINGARRICSNTSLVVVERIFGSWLIAASILLAALAIMPLRALEPEATPFDILIQQGR